MRNMLAIILTLLAVVGCAGPGQPGKGDHGPVELRRPALDQLQLVEGFSVIDRSSSGLSIAGMVSGNMITDWRVFDDQGEVMFQSKDDDVLSWDESCEIANGEPSLSFETGFDRDCCWEDWGCLQCDPTELRCEMQCETQRCRDANGQALPPVNPEDPIGRPSVAITPDRLVVAVDPEMPGWSALDAAGVRVHLVPRKSQGMCPVCARRGATYACWEVPCLPAEIASD